MSKLTLEMVQSDCQKVRKLLPASRTPLYHMITYGCQMNVRDSEILSGLLENMGYEATDTLAQADLVLFNTCCIRDHAEARLFGNLGALRKQKNQNPNMIIGICGCMTQQTHLAQEIKKRFAHVDFILGTNHPQELPRTVLSVMRNKERRIQPPPDQQIPLEGLPDVRTHWPSAFVSIMYGCNNFCSYCIVPYVRGREHSREAQRILDDIQKLADQGYKEVTLLGQNVNSFGNDTDDHMSFPDLLRSIDRINGIERIRFMTSHPKDLSDDLIEAMGDCKHVCNQLHLPVQSGSNAILAMMNRRYTREDYLVLVEKLRKKMPDIGLTTDFIVSFPGETERDFEDTISLVKQVNFAAAYMFAFSPRRGTKAADMEGQIDPKITKERLQRLIERQHEQTFRYHQTLIGTRQTVLIEGAALRGHDRMQGRIENGRTVTLIGEPNMTGLMVPVVIEHAGLNTLRARRVAQ